MRLSVVAAAVVTPRSPAPALAKLPPPSDDAKAKAAEAAAKAAWTDKVGAYQLCQSMDHVADGYRDAARPAAGKAASAPDADAARAPIPAPTRRAVTPAASKPLEASGAHSPPGTATSPPSNKATSAEMTGPRK